MESIPVSIISGYLGSGKTTLVNHLLRHPDGKRLAVLVNEFGDLAIDADLIEAQDDEMISLSGGCVCCSYGSGLVEAFLKLKSLSPPPDHIVLEASGVALPSAIANSLTLIDYLRLDSIVCLVDASQIMDQTSNPYLADTIARQLTDADVIVLNKSDLVREAERNHLRMWLKKETENAKVIETEYAKAAGELVLRPFEQLRKSVENSNDPHGSAYQSCVVKPHEPVLPDQFVETLFVEHPNLIRAKGFVPAMNNVMKTIQIVGKRVEITDAPPGTEPGVVVISLKAE